MADTVTDPRQVELVRWLEAIQPRFTLDLESIAPASSDASFRRYFRIGSRAVPGGSVIAMDAPPEREKCTAFVQVGRYLAGANVAVPALLAENIDQGFLLLSDLGSATYLSRLDGENAATLYRDATDALIRIQCLPDVDWLPRYDRTRLSGELDLFEPWYVERHLECVLTSQQKSDLAAAFDQLLSRHLAEPQVTVHRDYHSRNLMVLEPGSAPPNPGVLDFQDAVRGPASYDVVSLLRDAYIEWPEDQVLDWAVRYWERARRAGVALSDDFGEFWLDFEWMGLQRHLKVLGIFARLFHRDGKAGYLADLPRVLHYARKVAQRYSVLTPLARLFDALENKPVQHGYTF